ncbi:MAG: cytochrome c biogenesis protein CcsA [Bacteroidota bacterium]|nr:cytochrome c biogenesis protein CcsA [Bacteroidota bacterium]MDP4234070.1 cytochrome c biogenesis protein CcsA [Bacteroidota bacterium]MDP4243011.1 cytochrome c biogenesis protein CcsA [Bacteroidota bacterium]MDP4287437.1 cytochrome c biogenesis protein CcsA [Bacteroidota bacterium]
MLGNIALALTFTASLAGMVLYALAARGRTEYLVAARRMTQLALLGMFVACATLLYHIFSYHFEYNYVYEHASRKLSKFLLFSTFYASQEGSFMLWGLWTAIIAVFLLEYARRQRYEAQVMAIYLSVLVFISLMLLTKSPFETIYAAHPGEAVKGFIPPDGKGLNPSLENLWIVIHPPMLFLGFSLLAVPFAFALAGLLRRDYQGWVVTSIPWTLGAAMVLGFGIMLGGFWAYETLGWGGFWGWDPVENASLLPWLVTVAAVHTMLTQRRTGGLIKTNIGMTLLAYALVLYGSFMTRSGVLGEASVHSFADPGNLAFTLLVCAMGLFILVPLAIFLWRWREMSGFGQNYQILSRETSLSLASAVLGASALVVFIGTSAPLLKKKVDPDFYTNLHIPLIVVLLVINGLSLLLKWRQSNGNEVLKKSITALVATGVITLGIIWMGVRDLRFIAIIAAAFFALSVNIQVGWKVLRGHWNLAFDRNAPTKQDYLRRVGTALGITLAIGLVTLLVSSAGDYNLFGGLILQGWPYFTILFAALLVVFVLAGYPAITVDTKFLGAYVAHIGIAVFVLGVVASAGYTDREIIRLPIKKPVVAFGGKYTLTFRGVENAPNEHTYWLVDIADKHGYVGTAKPLTFWTDFNQHSQPILNPGIVKFASRDLYFTLNSAESEGGTPRDTLGKMQEVSQFGDSLRIKFLSFEFPQSERTKMMAQQPFRVKADIVANGDTLTLGVTRNPATEEASEEDVIVPGTSYHVQLDQLMPDMKDPSKSRVVLRVFDDKNPPPPPTEVITVEAFMKPYINLVWAGILTLVVGFGFSTLRRRREAIVAIERAERAYEKLLAEKHGMSPDSPAVPGAIRDSRPQLKIKRQV